MIFLLSGAPTPHRFFLDTASLPETMRGGHRLSVALVALLMLPLLPVVGPASAEQPLWRSVGLDPADWTDRPSTEDSPMMDSYSGNAVIRMTVSYVDGHPLLGNERVEDAEVIIELFEAWAPITTNNMIEHVESGLYDGIFFHRVIDDFVTQAGDPTCKRLGVYPMTSPECGSGGTGETIPLEHNESLSHVDGAIGMARSTDPDSADSQWYITDTEAHGLDPENRDDEGYATFGIVRDGMSHIRAIARSPTSDDPTGIEEIQNPASSAGRPLYEVTVVKMEMIGVADPDGTIRNPPTVETAASATSWLPSGQAAMGWLALLALPVAAVWARTESPARFDAPLVMEAELMPVAASDHEEEPIGDGAAD